MKRVLSILPPKIFSEVVIEDGLITKNHWIEKIRELANHFVMIADAKVYDLFGNMLEEKMNESTLSYSVITHPFSEVNKSARCKEEIEERMMREHLGRDTAIIAVGGGVATDTAGFIAATYLRGIPYVSIPTTLLAMVDAAIGGKVGLNTRFGKNQIGAFHFPRYIFIDPRFLRTVTDEELSNGVCEIIKIALIASPTLYGKLQKGLSLWQKRDLTYIQELIEESCALKIASVEKDPFEMGYRRQLNFGHSFAHALETLSGYTFSHGFAVALGIKAKAYLSFLLGKISEKERDAIITLLNTYGFSLKLPFSFSEDDFLKALKADKKSNQRKARFVLLESVGRADSFEGAYCTELPEELIREAVRYLKEPP